MELFQPTRARLRVHPRIDAFHALIQALRVLFVVGYRLLPHAQVFVAASQPIMAISEQTLGPRFALSALIICNARDAARQQTSIDIDRRSLVAQSIERSGKIPECERAIWCWGVADFS